ncbi:hypothetical protein ACFYO1_31680 [Nocardia sp. NPDC006044]|uniref:hypothetical protein n=1 Tax=Nocardia sp. NPDC006044 TaxID=3364306 RepID=UPI0036B87591
MATAATRRAHAATSLPSWGPVAAGAAGGIAAFLLCTAIDDSGSILVRAILAVAGIAVGAVYFRLLRWLRDVRRARGILPLPIAEWKQNTMVILVVAITPIGLGGLGIWLQLVPSAIIGVWIWFVQARPRISVGKLRSWQN